MELTIEQKKRIAIQFIGYGNPRSRLWFMGREEGKGYNKFDDKMFFESNDIVFDAKNLFDEGEIISSTYGKYENIVKTIFPDLWDGEKKDFFVCNLYPFGKPSGEKNISPEEIKLFGFDQNMSYKEIIDLILKDRFLALEVFFKSFNWKEKYIFYCIGNGFNNKFPNKHLLEFFKYLYN